MKIFTKLSLVMVLLIVVGRANSQNNFWTDVSESSLRSSSQKRVIIPEKGRTLTLFKEGLQQFLNSVPAEFSPAAKNSKVKLAIPMPSGGFQTFNIVSSSMMEPSLAALVPSIRTYSGQGIEDPTATIKIDVTPFGFHAMILSSEGGAVFIDPYFRSIGSGYISYYKKDFKSTKKLIENQRYFAQEKQKNKYQERAQAGPCIAGVLKSYRLAVACTGEYAQAVGATTKELALAAIVTSVNRVNGIYEKELDIRLTLVDSNLKIVFVDPLTDKFNGNNESGILIDESQKVITDSIGSLNFDIGHTFSTGGGGIAGLGVVCKNAQKASGITGSSMPAGDPYDIDFVAHEIGHQFGATHTFNANTGNCSGNGDKETNVEPGSGSTIMAYAGICGINNLQVNSDPQFHAISLQQINAYISGTGNLCAMPTNTGNTAPVVNAGANFIIPKSTPFIVNGSATDANNDPLTYSWEEMDFGGIYGNASSPSGNAPLFRSFAPVASTFRFFPKLSSIVNNTTTFGEALSNYGRNINLRLTARDNKDGGGGVCSDDMLITVNGSAGPFVVNSPNTATSWDVGSFKTVTWNVSGTDAAPISTSQVNISLSTDGGFTFPILLAANTPNDGSEEIKVPNNITTQARVRVMASGNIFFDMSNTNFTLKNATTTEFIFNNPSVVTSCNGINPFTILKTSGLNGYNTPINLTADGIPAGTTVLFSSNPVTPGQDVTVTLQGTLAQGKYIITVNGASGSITKSQNLEFVVGPLSTAATLNVPASNAIGQPVVPNFAWSSVSGASSYNLEVASNSTFANVVQSATNIITTNFTLPSPLAEATEYFWRIKANNICGSGTPSTGFRFKTVSTVCASPVVSTDVPKVIPDSGKVTSTINIVNGVIISDLNVVGLKGTHEFISDIGIKLTSPNNTTVILFDEICDNELSFDLNLDDESATVAFPCPPINGVTVRPTEELRAFDGQASTGTWTLTIEDFFKGDAGSLTSWGLSICSNVASPLPVNWLSFTAQKNNKKQVNLQWSTANETKNHYYTIERSADGVSFSSIGKLAGGNNLSMLQQYYFNDLKPYTGINFYRLKQVDLDGQFSYSSVVKVTLDKTSQTWTIYPNPAHNQSTIRLLDNMKNINIGLTDASGKIVYRTYLPSGKVGEQIKLPLQNLAKGIYILKIETETESRSDKIIVQ